MKTITSNDQTFKMVKQQLKQAREMLSQGKKMDESSKKWVSGWLSENRGIDLSKLDVGESLLIKCDGDDCFLLTIKGRDAVDLKMLALNYPAIEKECRKKAPYTNYELLGDVKDKMVEIPIPESLKGIVADLEAKKVELERSIASLEKLRTENAAK